MVCLLGLRVHTKIRAQLRSQVQKSPLEKAQLKGCCGGAQCIVPGQQRWEPPHCWLFKARPNVLAKPLGLKVEMYSSVMAREFDA